VLSVGRAGLHRMGESGGRRGGADPPWTERLRQLIQQHPTFGYRRLWVLLRFQDGMVRASTVVDPAPPRAGLGESGESE
jgi:putative transposase